MNRATATFSIAFAVLTLTGCQPTLLNRNELLTGQVCEHLGQAEHCPTVLVIKNLAGKNIVTVDPDPLKFTGKIQRHWILWRIDDSKSTDPGTFTFAPTGITTSSTQIYDCSRPKLVGNRFYFCRDFNNDSIPITYDVNLLDKNLKPVPVDPMIANDG